MSLRVASFEVVPQVKACYFEAFASYAPTNRVIFFAAKRLASLHAELRVERRWNSDAFNMRDSSASIVAAL